MDHATLIAVFVVIAAIAIVIDTIILLGFFLAVWRIYRLASEVSRIVRLNADSLALAARGIVEIVSRLKEPVSSVAATLADVSRLVRDRAVSLDSALGDMVDRTHLQTERLDLLVSNVLGQLETTVTTAQRAIASPVQELAAVAKGVQAGFDFFFSKRRPSNVREGTQDDEMFI